jgi:hypothetical protein
LYAAPYRAPVPAEDSRFVALKRCGSVLLTMFNMLGQLAQRGV